jgi:Lrp/AsnC family leucine-responsive transcriptional regulator
LSQSEREKLLDSLGWKLLHELQTDARISFAKLGRRVGLSTPAVAERVRRMEDEGIIRAYRAEIDPARVGLPITAFIRMSIVGNVLVKLTECVHTMPEIVECNRGTGEDSFILKVSAVSIEHLKDVIDRLTPFGTTSTSLVLESLIERNLLTPEVLDWGASRKQEWSATKRPVRSTRSSSQNFEGYGLLRQRKSSAQAGVTGKERRQSASGSPPPGMPERRKA